MTLTNFKMKADELGNEIGAIFESNADKMMNFAMNSMNGLLAGNKPALPEMQLSLLELQRLSNDFQEVGKKLDFCMKYDVDACYESPVQELEILMPQIKSFFESFGSME